MPSGASNIPVPAWALALVKYRSLFVPIGFISLLIVIVVPMPPMLMDVFIASNISIAVIMLLTTIYAKHPLEFSVFPSLLLFTTLFRLVLNIASTRLILSADAATPAEAVNVAGKVISAFGTFVAGDSLVVGGVIFLILIIVQFVVITKGSTRISEVAARFTLDAMPGKQMAIDADLNAGIINEQEARSRRTMIQDEADFYGAMDGASKFVRGDAVAGIIITAVNIVGGLTVGALEKGWSLSETASVFTTLTIGDGLVSQIPAFVIAIAAGLLVTRAGSKDSLGEELAAQLTSKPTALAITGGFMALLALTPLPTVPMLGAAAGLGLSAFLIDRQAGVAKNAEQSAQRAKAAAEIPEGPPIEKLMKVDALELEVGFGLVPLVDTAQGGDLLDRIAAIRRQLAVDMGLVMPPVRIRDNMTLEPNIYNVKIRGSRVAQGIAYPDRLLAMDSGIATGRIEGTPTKEPAFGLDAWWIEKSQKQRAEAMNYTVVDPASVITTHLTELVRKHASELLTREEVNNLIEHLKEKSPKLVEEVFPGVAKPGELQKILQNLLREGVAIRDLETIVETLSDWGAKTKDLDVLTEYARNGLRRSICQQYATPIENRPDASGAFGSSLPTPGEVKLRLVCVTLDPAFEDVINGYIDRSAAGTSFVAPAHVANALAKRMLDALAPVLTAGNQPVVIASPQVRSAVRQILEPHLPNAAVLGYNEIVAGVEVESLGLVTTGDVAAPAAVA